MGKVIKILAAALFFAALGWLGMYLFWHFKIVGAIKTLQTQAAPPAPGSALPYSLPEDAMGEIRAAGCRALPYLVSSLDAGKNPAYLAGAFDLIQKAVVIGDAPPTGDFPADARFSPDDQTPDRERKCRAVQDWWRYRGVEYHQSWRVWKDRCPRE